MLPRPPISKLALLSAPACINYEKCEPSSFTQDKKVRHVLFPLPVRNSVNVMPAAAAQTYSKLPDTGSRGPFTSVNVLTSGQGLCPH